MNGIRQPSVIVFALMRSHTYLQRTACADDAPSNDGGLLIRKGGFEHLLAGVTPAIPD